MKQNMKFIDLIEKFYNIRKLSTEELKKAQKLLI